MTFTRVSLINQLLQRTVGDSYLEIGVRRGETLCHVASDDKTGVDPNPQFDKLASDLRPVLAQAIFHKTDSNSFFASNTKHFDVVFIDGLHQYEQVMTDIANAFNVLKPSGFIVLHDCCPTDAYSATREWHTGAWYGDVWKTIYQINRDYPAIGHAVVPEDCGLGILWRKADLPQIVYDPSLIDTTFDLYASENDGFLNLTEASKLESVLPPVNSRKQESLFWKIVRRLGCVGGKWA